jgi:hypothetical protein
MKLLPIDSSPSATPRAAFVRVEGLGLSPQHRQAAVQAASAAIVSPEALAT